MGLSLSFFRINLVYELFIYFGCAICIFTQLYTLFVKDFELLFIMRNFLLKIKFPLIIKDLIQLMPLPDTQQDFLLNFSLIKEQSFLIHLAFQVFHFVSTSHFAPIKLPLFQFIPLFFFLKIELKLL